MENLGAYSVGMFSLLVFVLIVLVQGALVGAGKAKAGMTPGAEPPPDYENPMYRLNRSHQNGVENMAAAAIVLFAAILVGVSAWWTNLLMIVFLATRILYVLIYAQKVGNPTQGMRTFVYVAGWAMLVILAILALLKLV